MYGCNMSMFNNKRRSLPDESSPLLGYENFPPSPLFFAGTPSTHTYRNRSCAECYAQRTTLVSEGQELRASQISKQPVWSLQIQQKS